MLFNLPSTFLQLWVFIKKTIWGLCLVVSFRSKLIFRGFLSPQTFQLKIFIVLDGAIPQPPPLMQFQSLITILFMCFFLFFNIFFLIFCWVVGVVKKEKPKHALKYCSFKKSKQEKLLFLRDGKKKQNC